MKVDNVKSQMRKGMLEYCIMLLLHKEPSYASDIIQKLKEAQLIVVEGTLYPLLTRLKNDDLLSYEWVESTQGPPRKYYKLTEQGEVFLRELEISWKELNETVNHIANSRYFFEEVGHLAHIDFAFGGGRSVVAAVLHDRASCVVSLPENSKEKKDG